MVQRFAIQKIAFQRLDHLINFPLWTIYILQQILDAVPVVRTIEFTSLTFIEEFTVLLTHVFLVLSTMPDLHRLLPIHPDPVDRRLGKFSSRAMVKIILPNEVW